MVQPFFSIIVPCYNCSKSIERLLDSILRNNMNKDLYEVIIVDDKSTDGFLNLVKPYEDKMNIVYTETTRDVHCPGNTREAGLPYVNGQWLCFIDNDDLFEDDVFLKVKEHIETTLAKTESPEKCNTYYEVVCRFRAYSVELDKYGKEYNHPETDTWLHGKFFNVEHLLKKFNIHFKDDLFSHEDLFFNSMCSGHLRGLGLDYDYIDTFGYKWVENPNSLSRSYFNTEHYYIETYLKDYIVGAGYPYFDFVELYPENKVYYVHQVLMTFLHAYFYFEAGRFRIGNKILGENYHVLHEFKQLIIEKFNTDDNEIQTYIYKFPSLYNTIKLQCFNGAGEFIETESFSDFLKHI